MYITFYAFFLSVLDQSALQTECHVECALVNLVTLTEGVGNFDLEEVRVSVSVTALPGFGLQR